MSNKSHKLMSLSDIFAEKTFIIPDYQRGYSWETEQRIDLLSDLSQLSSNSKHFTGTIVATPSNNNQFEIVDGQQRITTLILLLKAIHSKLQDDSIKSAFLYSGEESGSTEYKLSLNGDLNKFYKDLLVNGAPELNLCDTKSKVNLQNAIEEFNEWANNKDDEELKDASKKITQDFGFIFYTPESSKEVGIMFEVINNRGKKLSELEKLKNYFVYIATRYNLKDLEAAINENWGTILRNLSSIGWHSNNSEDTFLRNCWIVFEDPNKSKSHQVYHFLKEKYPAEKAKEQWKRLNEFVKFMVAASNSLKRLFTEDSNFHRYHISLHPTRASILPLYLAIDIKLNDGGEKNRLFELIEKLNFRYYVTGIAGRSDSGQGDTFGIANRFYKQFMDSHDENGEPWNSISWLEDNLIRFIQGRANDTSLVKALTLDKDESGNYYNWKGLKYFLACYEESLAKENKQTFNVKKAIHSRDPEAKNDFFHKEHIWAVKEISLTGIEKELNINKRRLGNFTLLKENLNIKVSNAPIPNKIKMYTEDSNEDLNTRMLLELPQIWNGVFDPKKRKTKKHLRHSIQRFLDTREEKLLNFAIKRWQIPQLEKTAKIVKVDSFRKSNEVFDIEFTQNGL